MEPGEAPGRVYIDVTAEKTRQDSVVGSREGEKPE